MLQLGQHAGNHFRIVLRGALGPQPQPQQQQQQQQAWEVVDAAAQSLKEHGFINYFGEQRFQPLVEAGTTSSSNESESSGGGGGEQAVAGGGRTTSDVIGLRNR